MDGEMNMSHGDGDTIHEDLEEDYFPPNFKEYMLEEQIKWWRVKRKMNYPDDNGWVFWSQHDHKITRALQKWILDLDPLFRCCCLVQFWAAAKTLEGRTRLTTQFQPFALSPSFSTRQRQELCEYRMKMCSSEYNNCFADAQSGEEQLGLPGRVFLHQSTESTPDVMYYSTKEYTQLDLALRCQIRGSWAVPVFEQSSWTCVGVLEMVSRTTVVNTLDVSDWPIGYSPRNMEIFLQEFGLECGYQACVKESRKRGKRVKGLTNAFQELQMGLESVCRSHELPLSMTWVLCSACNGLQRCKLGSSGVEFRQFNRDFLEFLRVTKCHHMRKGLVAGRAPSFSSMLYCSDITKLSFDDYPLVPYARKCKFSGWFRICLLNVNTGNDIYVLDFFLSRSKDDEDIHTTLKFILGTMDNNFKNFRLASGKELGELTSVDIIYFQNDKKIHSVQRIQATRDFSNSIASSVQSSASVAYTGPGFHDANMGTIKAKFDSESSSDSDPSFEQSSTSVANTRPGFQDANMVIIKAKYGDHTEKFKLSLPCRLVELQQKVVERLKLKAGTYHVYKDEELIACEKDLQAYVDASISQGNTSTVFLLEPKEPATYLNPTN